MEIDGSRRRCARLWVIGAQRLKLLVRVREVFDRGLQRQCPCFAAPLISLEQRDHALGSADEVHRLGQQRVRLVVHVVRVARPFRAARLNGRQAETIRRIEIEHVEVFTLMHSVSRRLAIDATLAAALPFAS
jgi:hypothetical protein